MFGLCIDDTNNPLDVIQKLIPTVKYKNSSLKLQCRVELQQTTPQ